MNIRDTYGPAQFALSFELFPPKTAEGEQVLARHVERLVQFQPAYITCTYGAGGSTQGKTLDIIAAVRAKYGLPVATHLTCVGSTADELAAYLQRATDMGVTNVVALRGDPPQGMDKFTATAGGFSYANELVAFIRERFAPMGIAVGGYPETHREALSAEHDLDNLKRKIDAGADVIITQLFYDNADFWRFRDHALARGITIPIVPGLLPVTNFGQIRRISQLCGARIPTAFAAELEAAGDDEAAQFRIGVQQATEQLRELITGGIPGLHLYVLNKSEAATQVLNDVELPRK